MRLPQEVMEWRGLATHLARQIPRPEAPGNRVVVRIPICRARADPLWCQKDLMWRLFYAACIRIYDRGKARNKQLLLTLPIRLLCQEVCRLPPLARHHEL